MTHTHTFTLFALSSRTYSDTLTARRLGAHCTHRAFQLMRLVADLNEDKPEPRVVVIDSSVRVMLTQRSHLPAPFASAASTLCLATLATASTHARNCQHPLPRQGGGEKGSGGTSGCPLHLGLKAPDDSTRREKGGRTERRKQRERERGMERALANLKLRPMPDPHRSNYFPAGKFQLVCSGRSRYNLLCRT